MLNDSINAIRSLSESNTGGRTKVGQIRELLPEIEKSQQMGVPLKLIVAALNDSGFPGMNIKCLQNLLYQVRRKNAGRRKCVTNVPSGSTANSPALVHSQTGGINAEEIMSKARRAATNKLASPITLSLLRKSSDPQ